MEQDVKVGSLGDVKFDESLQGESVSGKLGPLQINVQISNADLVALVASRLSGGVLHDAAVALQAALFPAAPAAAPSAPSA